MSSQLTPSERRERQRQLEKAYPRPVKESEQGAGTTPKRVVPETGQNDCCSRSGHHSA